MAMFDRLKAALTAKAPTADQLERALAEARQVSDAAAADVAELEVGRRGLLAAPEPDRVRHKAALAAAEDRKADAALYVDELAAKYEAARAGEAEESRRKTYTAVKRKAAAAKARLEAEYPDLGARFVSLLRDVTEAQVAVAQVNEDLPDGALRLADPEELLRDRPTLIPEVISERVLTRWCVVAPFVPLDPVQALKVRETADGKGIYELGGIPREVERRKVKHTIYLAHEPGWPGPRLRSLRLPELRYGEEPFWRGALSQALPRDVLDALNQDAGRPTKPQSIERHRERLETWTPYESPDEPEVDEDTQSSLEGET